MIGEMERRTPASIASPTAFAAYSHASGTCADPSKRRTARIVAWIAFVTFPTASLHAVERVSRVYDERSGLAVAEIAELAQDSRGFLWIGTIGGLVRFDGNEMRPWAADEIRHVIQVLETGPRGEVLVAGRSEPLMRVVGEGVEEIVGPHGRPMSDWVHATMASDGATWVATTDTLWRNNASEWTFLPREAVNEASFYRVQPGKEGTVYVGTTDALWIVQPSLEARFLAPIRHMWAVRPLADGTPMVLARNGPLWRLDAGGPTLIESTSGGIGLATRGSTAFAAVDRNVFAYSEGKPAEILAPAQGVLSGRPLLVDREGSLWIGGFRGLIELSEPATVAYNDADGLPPPAHAHHLERTADAVWVVTWHGSVRVDLQSDRRSVVRLEGHSGRLEADAHGRVWGATLDQGLECWVDDVVTRYPRPGVHGLYGTSARPDGSTWLSTDDGLFLAPPSNEAPSLVRAEPPRSLERWTDSWLGPVLEDRDGRLWVARGDTVYSAPADSVAHATTVRWRGTGLPESGAINDIVELDDGTVWAGTSNSGVFERRAGSWISLEGNRELGSLRVYGMVRSPSGGVWILTAGTLARVERRSDRASGWEIVERLGTWQGLPTQQASDLHEDPDGRLWLATLAGLVEVAPSARFAPLPPPRVELVDVRVDGRRVDPGSALHLAWRQNLEVRFAALSYRDRSRLRYEVRIDASSPWRPSSEPTFRFVNLAPGSYEAEVRASLDGVTWTEAPARVAFVVSPPWWRRPWVVVAFLLAGAAAAFALHRMRVGVLLGLERQRLRIARDLHDEMGSGLGSIGILASLASDERLDRDRRREVTMQIGETAAELGSALGDMVRSLAQGADTLEAFASRLAARARRLAPGEAPSLAVRRPDVWPDVRVAAEVQREVQAIVAEAIHNAVKHASAQVIELGFRDVDGGYLVWVRDDGIGLDGRRAPNRSGHGLANMKARAASMGTEVSIGAPADGRGTLVELHFPIRGRTIMRRRRASQRDRLNAR